MIMRVLASRLLSLVAPIALLAALAYSQFEWRHDRTIDAELRQRFDVSQLQRSFPSDGEDLAGSPLHVIRGNDTIPLADVVRGRKAVIYFGRPNCSTCTWFAATMDSILPTWRDSLVVVTSYGKERGPVSGLTLDSTSSLVITGVPAMLVVDSTGSVVHSVPAGLPQVARVLDFVGLPSPSRVLLKDYRDNADAARRDSVASGARQ